MSISGYNPVDHRGGSLDGQEDCSEAYDNPRVTAQPSHPLGFCSGDDSTGGGCGRASDLAARRTPYPSGHAGRAVSLSFSQQPSPSTDLTATPFGDFPTGIFVTCRPVASSITERVLSAVFVT